MSETTLELRLMKIPLSENKPMENFDKLRTMLVNDTALNKTLDNYFDSHSAERAYLAKNGFMRNAFKLVIAHALYQRFEKYRDKHFGPALFQYGNYEYGSGKCSRLNQDTDNAFCSTYVYFNYNQRTMPIEEVILVINQTCGLNMFYEKNHSGGVHCLTNRGITNPEFLSLYHAYRTELMQNPRIYAVYEEVNNLFRPLNRPRLKKSFVEGIINTIIGYNMINTNKKYADSCITSSNSKINTDSNKLFVKAYYFFKNNQHFFEDFDYAKSFIEHCGFDLRLNKNDALNDAERVETIEEINLSCQNTCFVIKPTNNQELLNPLYRHMCGLSLREQEIIKLRYGLACDSETLQQIACKQGVTKQTILQIEERAIAKLRKKMQIELNNCY